MSRHKAAAMAAMLLAFVKELEDSVKAACAALLTKTTDFDAKMASDYVEAKAAQTQTVVQGVVIVVVASIGVVIVSNIDSSLGSVGNSNLSQSQEGLLTGFGNMIDLIEPLLIVLIAVVVIAVIQRIQQ